MSYKPFTSTLARVHTSGISSSDQEAVPPVGKGDSVDSELAESKSSAIDEIIETIFNRRVAKKYNYKLSRDVEKEAVSLLPQHTVRKRGSITTAKGDIVFSQKVCGPVDITLQFLASSLSVGIVAHLPHSSSSVPPPIGRPSAPLSSEPVLPPPIGIPSAPLSSEPVLPHPICRPAASFPPTIYCACSCPNM